MIAFYNYGGTTTGALTFFATGQPGDKAFSYPKLAYKSTQWDYTKSTFIPGDFNGDGRRTRPPSTPTAERRWASGSSSPTDAAQQPRQGLPQQFLEQRGDQMAHALLKSETI